MVEFLLGLLLGMMGTLAGLHFYGKHLHKRHSEQVGLIIKSTIQESGEYAVA